MKKATKIVLIILAIPVLIIGATIGRLVISTLIESKINEKKNSFDINESSFLALSYQDKDKKDKEKTNYCYISTKMQRMDTDTPFVSDHYENYYIDLSECFNVENMNKYTLIKKEVKDKSDNPIPYNEKYDSIFEFVTNYAHNILDDIELYDLGKAVVITYMPNFNWFSGMYIGYFSQTFRNSELVQVDKAQPLSGIKLYTVL